ncbi:Zinc finger protein Rlf [Acipenser ruthenus]|uniref:Zinc finger protein Rlf n=1 Tax=Acipenser ruthenus TaxID=7906 RepID=A0A444V4J3_ACIRT|nr:Zinc finger protein Rlf [Acipenser ruthenus]
MADGEGETEMGPKERAEKTGEDSPFALDSLLKNLRELEDELRQQDVSVTSSGDYCSSFCEMLVQYAGSRNAQEHGLSLLEVYRLSIQSFALARPHLTTECENVLLVLGRLALSCFELLLSVPENEIPYEVWLQFHQSVLSAHKALLEFGNGVLLALLEITNEGGAWRNPVLLRILTQQPTEPQEVSKFIAGEGPAFLEMRIKHLIKTNNVPQAMLLAKLCAESGEIAHQTPFRQVYISHLCDMLPSEEAIQEISNVDCKEILDMVCNLEAEGQENQAFILCTTYLTQQLQKGNMYCSWELTLFWSKLQRRIDPSLETFLDRCRRFGVIAKTAYHLLFLVRVIQTEELELGEIKIDCSTLEDEALQSSRKPAEDDYITFSYIAENFELRDRDIYPCPATDCLRLFKHFKYLSVHLKAEHPESDVNARHYLEMKDRREKCTFCRRHFLTPFHHRQHRRVHYGKLPYMCVAAGCGARFNSTNELVAHKQAHGYQLSYQCELKGCSLTFSDLGQLYHHEAQHFRDAAYSCIHPGCKKFYYSKKEFAKHLASHGLTFSEDNLMSYRKVKQDFEGPLGESVVGPVEGSKAENTDVPKSILEELVSGIKTETPDFSQLAENPTTASVPPASGSLTGTLTSVAVCFDGKKFTCGFEGCGLTFIQARDIQRHLKNVHPLQFKRHKKGERTKKMCKKSASSRKHQSQSRKPLRFQEHSSGGHSSLLPDPELGHSDPLSTEIDFPNPAETQPSSSNEESLIEILARLSQLSLKTPIIAASSPTTHSVVVSSFSQVSLPSTAGDNPPTKPTGKKAALKSQPHQCGYKKELPAAAAEEPSTPPLPPQLPSQHNKPVSQFLVQASNKPYFCELKDCKYRSVARAALLVHYLKKHSMSKDKVMGMEMFHRKFKPFECHLCPSAFTRKSQLRLHLMSQHKLSETLVAQMSCSKKRRGDRDKNNAEKVPDSYGSGVSLDPELPEKGQQKKEASNWGKKFQKRRRVGVYNTEFEKKLQEEEMEEEETVVKAMLPAIEDNGEEEAREGRGSRRLVAKGNLCYILTKYNKPFECVHKGCSSAFTNQNGLIRHLRLVHRYNRDQLCMEGGQQQGGGAKKDRNCSKRFRRLSGLARHSEEFHRPEPEGSPEPEETPEPEGSPEPEETPEPEESLEAQTLASEEPIPQFSCSYSDCTASYHLYSSLLRHQHLLHRDQTLQPCNRKRTRSNLRCTYEGCTRVFSHRNNYEQHVFCMHRNNYDSFVLRLQNEKEEDRNKGASGCQKKLISVIATPSPSVSPPLQSPPRQGKGPAKKVFMKGNLLLRTPEEALQMCEDRNIPVAYPCMVQDCESVVTLESSLIRHYKHCHNIRRTYLGKHYDKLVNNAEKLEATIQKNSTPPVPTLLDKAVNMEYQKELKNPLASELPVSLPSIKSSLDEQDHLGFGEEVSENDFTLDADGLLYGEAVKKSRCYSSNGGQPRRNGFGFEKKPEPPPPPPPTLLCFSREDGFLDLTCKGGGKGTGSFSSVSRPPLKRKNEQADPLLTAKENYQCPRNLHNRSPTPRTFDLKTYKPMGFESSFLKFIQESEGKDEVFEESPPEPQVVIKRRDAHRRGCSVKENSRRRLGRNKNGSLVHGKLSAFQPLLSAGESATVQNLRSILDKALADCGDLALKQLHYLKPVVVLERSKFSTSLLDLFPTKKADELCLASS